MDDNNNNTSGNSEAEPVEAGKEAGGHILAGDTCSEDEAEQDSGAMQQFCA